MDDPVLVTYDVGVWVKGRRSETVKEDIENALIASPHVSDFGVDIKDEEGKD